jgi:hypothetical protein
VEKVDISLVGFGNGVAVFNEGVVGLKVATTGVVGAERVGVCGSAVTALRTGVLNVDFTGETGDVVPCVAGGHRSRTEPFLRLEGCSFSAGDAVVELGVDLVSSP